MRTTRENSLRSGKLSKREKETRGNVQRCSTITTAGLPRQIRRGFTRHVNAKLRKLACDRAACVIETRDAALQRSTLSSRDGNLSYFITRGGGTFVSCFLVSARCPRESTIPETPARSRGENEDRSEGSRASLATLNCRRTNVCRAADPASINRRNEQRGPCRGEQTANTTPPASAA